MVEVVWRVGEWEVQKAKNLFLNRIEHGEDELPIYSVTMNDGLAKRDSLDRKIDDISLSSGNKKVYKNDIAYNMMRMWQGASGVAIEDCMVSPTYIVLKPSNLVHADFYGYFLKLPQSLQMLTAYSHGLTKDRLRLYYKDFAQIPLPRPSLDEQKKIASCLSSLDALIAAHADKLDALKIHKKGLMQQLFPREGETVPRLRFPEFREAGEWQLLPLDGKVELLSGFPFKGQDISDDPSGIPLMRGVNITEGFIRHSTDIDRFFLGDPGPLKKYRLEANDLIIGMDGSKVGKNSAVVTKKDADSLLIQRVARLRTKCESTIQFIFQHVHSSKFHSYVDRINTSSGIPHISAKQINEFEIFFPPVEEEQKKVADCLSSLDALITAQAEKLEALQTHKQGLMQQLFPSPEAMAA